MRVRALLKVTLPCLLAGAAPLAAQRSAGDRALADLSGVAVVIERIDPAVLDFGVDSGALRQLIEAEVRQGGVEVLPTLEQPGAPDVPILHLSVRIAPPHGDIPPASVVSLWLQRAPRPDGSRPPPIWEGEGRERSPSLARLAEGVPGLVREQVRAFVSAVARARGS